MMTKLHSDLPASGADRWLKCPGSYHLGLKAPDLPRSKYSDLGTLAHSWMEKLLQTSNSLTRIALLNQIDDEEMKEALEGFLRFDERLKAAFLSTCDKGTFKEIVEERIEWSKYVGGTVDRAFVGKRNGEWEIAVVDFKYGEGKKVTAEDNPQLILYALMLEGQYCTKPVSVIRLYIYQPRIEGPDPISRFKLTGEDIEKWVKRFTEAQITALEDKGQTLVTGSHCHWCKAKAICPKQHEETFLPEEIMSKDLPVIRNEDLVLIYKKKEQIKSFLKAVEIYLNTMAETGVEFEGLKQVETKGRRSWADEEQTIKHLKSLGLDDEIIFNKKLKGITELKKHIDKVELDKLVSTPPIRRMLVPIEDERSEVVTAKLIERIDD